MKKLLFRILIKIKYFRERLLKLLLKYFREELLEHFRKELLEHFREDIEQMYIEEQLPTYNLKMGDSSVMEKISDLSRSPEYRIFTGLLSNRKNHLGREMISKKYLLNKEQDKLQSFYRGQAYLISHLFSLVKYMNHLYQIKKERSDKKKKGNKK